MFIQAQPVFPIGLSHEKNCFVTFEATVHDGGDCTLVLTAASFYRLFVDGRFVSFGPARAAAGYARVDEIALRLTAGEAHVLQVDVAGYACRSLSTVRQSSFLIAELRRGNAVLAATGRDFTARRTAGHVQKTERYSVQRHFGEVYDDAIAAGEALPLQVIAPCPVFLPRVAPYPRYEDVNVMTSLCAGHFEQDDEQPVKHDNFSFMPNEAWGAFLPEEIFYHPYSFIQAQRTTVDRTDVPLPLTLSAGSFARFDFGRIECGFITFSADVTARADVVIGFSEYCEDVFSFTDMHVQNVLEYVLDGPQKTVRISFEPYTLRHLILFVRSGSLCLTGCGVKQFARDMRGAHTVKTDDPALTNIIRAAENTFAHNALDLLTDCPSRERAGWLCDSYFTAQAEYFFFGKTPAEDAFLENYRLFSNGTGEWPDGVLPMCYPADYSGKYIPQWNLWYVLEASQYLTVRHPDADRTPFYASVAGVLRFFSRCQNENGMVERLPSWNFVEWSDANGWVHDVNYPTNFLYAAALIAAGETFDSAEWRERGEALRTATAKAAFDGLLFVDNAVRENGRLRNTRNTSEACQYYALLFGGLDTTDPRYAYLLTQVENRFEDLLRAPGDRRFVPVNAFIGLYLRMEVLLKLSRFSLLVEDVKHFFGDMAAMSGTLWEYRQKHGSFDHGFSSYAVAALAKALQNS